MIRIPHLVLAVIMLSNGTVLPSHASETTLSREAAEAWVQSTFRELSRGRQLKLQEREDGFSEFEIDANGKTMKCVGKRYGDAPMGQRSLIVSMHGGGGTSSRVNDRQWRNQIRLYRPKEGYYVAPRAPTNQWNMWHEPNIDGLFSRLIEDFVATKGVDPNRVYLMGYSAGGDGVFQLAPRMADRFAAASMMAGHPNSVSPDGLFNLPFRIYMGGKDAAYQRNEIAGQWKLKLAALQAKRGGYPHRVTIYPELGHWMNRLDAEAVPWMTQQTRNAWPKQVIWGETANRSERFYWLGGVTEGVVHASVEGQTISLSGLGDQPITLWLRDELIDLDQPMQVVIDNQLVYEGSVERSKDAILVSLQQRLDANQAATATITVQSDSGR